MQMSRAHRGRWGRGKVEVRSGGGMKETKKEIKVDKVREGMK